jgi:hypothetical protein
MFNPIINNTNTLLSGSKSYFYQLIIDTPTTINGFSVYLNSGGDPIRVAIYRNFIKSALPVSNATLVGQSLSTSSSSSLPYIRAPITAVVNQNLNFIAGEYMVIGFGSSGTTNAFLASPSMIGNTDIAFSSTTNYVAAGFPTILTSSQQSSILANKICFTLY